MKILITGSRGFIGKELCKRLSTSYIVFTYDREDTLDCTGVDIVYHCIADADSRGSNRNPIRSTENNIGMFVKVLQNAVKNHVRRFIFISSTEASEEKNVYAINKRACEKILQVIARYYNMDYVIVRPQNVYGPGMNISNPNRNVIASFMRSLIEQQCMKIVGDKKATRKFSYIKNVINILEKCVDEFTNQTITIGPEKETSIEELEGLILGLEKTYKWMKKRRIPPLKVTVDEL